VVGTGTPASCTFSALNAAVTKGGIITFDCGAAATTIAITATMNMSVSTNTVIDGGNLVTLDGQGSAQILNFNSPGWRTNDTQVTLQHIAFINGKTTPTQAIHTAPAPCSQGWTTVRAAPCSCATATSPSSTPSSRTTRPRCSDRTRAAVASTSREARTARSS
jgi:hypothetical protein